MLGYDWPRLHAMLTALPVALLTTAVLFELASFLLKKESLRLMSRTLLLIGVVGAAAALGAGLEAEDHIDHGPAMHAVIEEHQQLAYYTMGIFAVVAIWRLARERRMGRGERGVVLAISLAGLGVLAATGHHGGELVFEHAAGVPNDLLRAELTNRAESHHHHGGADPGEAAGDPKPDAHADSDTHADSDAGPSHTHPPGTPPHKD